MTDPSPDRTAPHVDPALAAELESIRSQLRDHEKALVERIADVDDDRRSTANQLQRAWQSQRDEIDARLRGHSVMWAGVLVLFAVLVAVAGLLFYRELESDRRTLAKGLAEVKKEVATVPGGGAQDDLARQQLTQLAAAVEGISSSLTRLDDEPNAELQAAVATERTARESAAAELADGIMRLEQAQDELTRQLETLRKAVTAAREETAVALAKRTQEDEQPPELAGEIANLWEAQAELTRDVEGLRKALTAADAKTVSALAAMRQENAAMLAAARRAAEEAAASVASAQPGMNEAPLVEETREAPSSESEAQPPPPRSAPEPSIAETVAESPEPLRPEVIRAREGTYGIQLIGLFDFQSLRDFAAREGMPERVYWRKETYQGRPWYILIHSLHPDYVAAQAERGRLPPSLGRLDVWLRPLPEGTELRVLDTRALR